MHRFANISSDPVTVTIALTQIEHGLSITLASGSKIAAYCGSIVATHTHTLVKTDAEVAEGISIALARSFAKPENGTSRTFRDAFTFTVPEPQVVLSRLVTLTSRKRIPSHGARDILRDAVPEVIASTQVKLSTGMTLMRRSDPPPCRLLPTLRVAPTVRESIPETKLSV